MDKIRELIMEAYYEAVKRGIKANTILINKNLVEVKPFIVNYSNGFSELPPQICGMQAFFTDKELPDDYAFSILEAKCTEREFLIRQTTEAVTRLITSKAIELSDDSETMYEFQNRLIDFVEQDLGVRTENETIIGAR